jgi:hypothetical protein
MNRVDVASLNTNDRWLFNSWQSTNCQSASFIGWDTLSPIPPQSKKSQSFKHSDVYLFANHNGYWRCAEQSVVLNVPINLPEYCMPCGGETCEIRHLRSGHESAC